MTPTDVKHKASALATRTKNLSSGWLGAIAGGIGAGVAIGGSGNRVVGGIVGGVVVWAVAMWQGQGEPCCDECAGAAPSVAPGEPEPIHTVDKPEEDWGAFFRGSGPTVLDMGKTGCGR